LGSLLKEPSSNSYSKLERVVCSSPIHEFGCSRRSFKGSDLLRFMHGYVLPSFFHTTMVLIVSKETLYGHKIDELRRAELKKVRTAAILRSSIISLTSFIPILAAILAFVSFLTMD
jgi:hypothetical protein